MASHRSVRTGRLLQLAQRIRVPAGFILAPLMIIASKPTIGSMLAGSVLSLAGLGIRGWASGYLRKNQELATSGPYAYTRNPLYLGTFLLGLGVSICAGSWWFICVFATIYLLIYLPVMIAEAETLKGLFPDEYALYSGRVPLLIPRLTSRESFPPVRGPAPGRLFDFSLYIRHREYRALIGFVTALAILILKAWLAS
jgi:protein-S-isoprenylcysteine O-methyltransferase Ste14